MGWEARFYPHRLQDASAIWAGRELEGGARGYYARQHRWASCRSEVSSAAACVVSPADGETYGRSEMRTTESAVYVVNVGTARSVLKQCVDDVSRSAQNSRSPSTLSRLFGENSPLDSVVARFCNERVARSWTGGARAERARCLQSVHAAQWRAARRARAVGRACLE